MQEEAQHHKKPQRASSISAELAVHSAITTCSVCRAMDLLLALAYTSDQALQQVLEAGAMPVIISTSTAYADSVKRDSALQPDANTEPGETSDGPNDATSDTFSFVPTPNAVLAALSLCQVSTDDLLVCVCVSLALCACLCMSWILHTCRINVCVTGSSGDVRLSVCVCVVTCVCNIPTYCPSLHSLWCASVTSCLFMAGASSRT